MASVRTGHTGGFCIGVQYWACWWVLHRRAVVVAVYLVLFLSYFCPRLVMYLGADGPHIRKEGRCPRRVALRGGGPRARAKANARVRGSPYNLALSVLLMEKRLHGMLVELARWWRVSVAVM